MIVNYALSASLLLAGASEVAAQVTAPAITPGTTPPAAREVRLRKNVDDLSPQELAAFEHAFQRMKEISQANIYDRKGFIWNAWIHNCNAVTVLDSRNVPLPGDGLKKLLASATLDSCEPRNFATIPASAKKHTESPGECEHRKNIFLQWHRAQLYFYEQALRSSDPEGKYGPSTRDVTLPYWNFTARPSGKRYPKAFENPNSPLYDATRFQDPLPSSLPTASPYLLAYLIYYQDWATFGGDQLGGIGQGNLETRIHNYMHNDYMGGKMQDNTKAALDPIFYVFHNFLDYSLEKWIEEHGAAAIPAGSAHDDYLRAQQDGGLLKPIGFEEGNSDPKNPAWGNYTVNMGRPALYFDTKKQGFAFTGKKNEFVPKSEIAALMANHQAAGFEFGDNPVSLMTALLSYGSNTAMAKPDIKLNGKYRIPAQALTPANGTARLRFSRAGVKSDYSFSADVYLYPEGTPENIGSTDFRNRYLVANTSHWGLSHNHPDSGIELNENVTAIVNSLVPKKASENWQITVAIRGSKGGKVDINDFSAPFITIIAPN